MTQTAKNLLAMQETGAQSLGRETDGYALQYSSLENPKDRDPGGLQSRNHKSQT